MNKIFKFIILITALIIGASLIFIILNRQYLYSSKNDFAPNFNYSEIKLPISVSKIPPSNTGSPPKKIENSKADVILKPGIVKVSAPSQPVAVKEVSAKSFEELVNISVVQLYCGNLDQENTTFSDISRGTGIIINDNGELLTNRHVIYDENLGKIKNSCFVLKSPFPNILPQRPKIYYEAEIISYPLREDLSGSFSVDKYYNDFAILKVSSKVSQESKINLLLGFDYASADDYSVLENDSGKFNFLPIDWDYRPKNNDNLVTLGYGIDASHLANQITSTIGKIAGNIDINKTLKPQILLVESNATAGFSGGALINPQSKGLVGLVSWITSGDETGKYTVAIFRDFLRQMMLQELNFDLK